MTAETARKFEALEAQAQKIMSVFIKAGHEAVAPATIQPAGIFLDVIGETLRARTYVFTDPDGDELCLRPDLTVPTCRLHLERHPEANRAASYCYNGAAFRFQPQGVGSAHPREFRQAGIEAFGAADREKAEAETVALLIAALRAAGLTTFKLRIGDLGLFRAVLKRRRHARALAPAARASVLAPGGIPRRGEAARRRPRGGAEEPAAAAPRRARSRPSPQRRRSASRAFSRRSTWSPSARARWPS